MSYVRSRIGALRAGVPMTSPGQGSQQMFGQQSGGVDVGVNGSASVQATGLLLVALVVLVIVGERVGR